MFDEATHSRLRDPTPSKDLHGISRSILRTVSAVHLQKGDLASKFGRLFFIRLISRRCQKRRSDKRLLRVETRGDALLTMLHIWYVTFSSQACRASARAIICASLERMTACELRGFPNAFLCETHLRHSSVIIRCAREDAQIITQRSWLKLLRTTKIPPSSGPRVFSTGTRTLSKVTKAVPAVGE